MQKVDDDFDPFGLKNEAANEPIQPLSINFTPQAEEPNALETSLFDPFGIISKPEDRNEKSDLTDEEDQEESDLVDDDVNISQESPPLPPIVSRITRSQQPSPANASKGNLSALAPKLNVKLMIYEEASSFAQPESEGASNITVEGKITAQVQCSDAKRNAPFCLEAADVIDKDLVIHPNMSWSGDTGPFAAKDTTQRNPYFFNIPKHEIGFVPIATYTLSETVQHMPLLLERKVVVTGTSCRVALQVRSKLSNNGDISDFTIALALPEHVDVTKIDIHRGDGILDEMKRMIKFTRSLLKRGESFMVSVQTELLDGFIEKELAFPVLLRCSSVSDQISDIDFRLVKAEGYPSSISCHKACSFLLIHRLP